MELGEIVSELKAEVRVLKNEISHIVARNEKVDTRIWMLIFLVLLSNAKAVLSLVGLAL